MCRLAVALVLLVLAGCAQHARLADEEHAHADAEARAAIERLREADVAAVRAQDVDALMALWSEDAVVLPDQGPPIRGRAAIREMLSAGVEQLDGVELLEYVQEWHDLGVSGDVAHEWADYRTRHLILGTGEVVEVTGKLLRILHREPDGWRVVRSMWTIDEP